MSSLLDFKKQSEQKSCVSRRTDERVIKHVNTHLYKYLGVISASPCCVTGSAEDGEGGEHEGDNPEQRFFYPQKHVLLTFHN